jgi:cell division septum initiation protein DivIVA
MSEYNEVVADGREDPFEAERRGYSRRQVDEYIAWRNGQIRELESKLGQGLTEIERLRRELAEAREAAGRPAHEEISERVHQILKLADDEAKALRDRGATEIAEMREAATAETDKLKADVKEETDRLRAEAQDRAERMLTAAQEQSERAITSARTEADSLLSAAQQSAEQTVNDASKHAESTVAAAIAKAKQQLDDATSRATAIHDGAERRLNLLISRHTETVRRLTEVRDVVTSLVAGETARGSLEDEVNRALAAQSGANGGDNRQQSSGPHDNPHAGAHRAGHRQVSAAGAAVPTLSAMPAVPAGPAESRRGVASVPLDGLEPPTPTPTPRASSRREAVPLEREQPEPLGAERRESVRHQVQSSDTAELPVDGDLGETRHATDRSRDRDRDHDSLPR